MFVGDFIAEKVNDYILIMATHFNSQFGSSISPHQKQLFISIVREKRAEATQQNLPNANLGNLQRLSQISPGSTARRRKAKASDWRTTQFRYPVTSPWDLALPEQQLSSLLAGYVPRTREDKYFVYADAPDDCGIATLHTFQAWTGFKISELSIDTNAIPARITCITWEADGSTIGGNSEQRAKERIRELYTWVLAKQAPVEEEDGGPASLRTRSWRGRLSELGATIADCSPPPSSSTSSYYASSRTVDVPKELVTSRPTSFYCPASP